MSGPAARATATGLVSVQDLGRPGHAHLGLSANGASDAASARTASLLVGNADGAPLLEGTGASLTLTAERPLLVAVTGAAEVADAAGSPRPWGAPFALAPGETIRVAPAASGLRWYLAINGLRGGPRMFGSVAPDVSLGLGRVLRAEEPLEVDSAFRGLDHPFSRIPLFVFPVRPRPVRSPVPIEVTRGPDAAEFPRIEELFEAVFHVSQDSDHVGVRMSGSAPERAATRELVSRGMPIGAIELPPGGEVIALLRGRFVTAGYPIAAVATRAGIDGLAQLRPGDAVRFRLVEAADAVREARECERELAELARRVQAAFRACGIGEVLADAPPGAA